MDRHKRIKGFLTLSLVWIKISYYSGVPSMMITQRAKITGFVE